VLLDRYRDIPYVPSRSPKSSVEEIKKERKREERRIDSQHHTIKVLVSFFARIKGCGQPLSASGEMNALQ
jgi:hypothetical protein